MKTKERKLLLLLWITAIVISFIAFYLTYVDCGYTKVCFLDVGQGDACYIKTSRGSTVMIDGGDEGNGEYVLRPFFRKEYTPYLDAVFLSHIHDDHFSGIEELLEQGFKIKTMYVSERAEDVSRFGKIKALAENNRTHIVFLGDDDLVEVDELDFWIISSGYDGKGETNENDNSMIMRMDCGENSILFTGDATKRYETQVLDNTKIDTDFLKVAHHGSYTSSGTEFLNQVSPEIAIISVGENNRYNHPSERTIETIDELDIPIMRTDYDGTISIIMNEKDVKSIRGSRERRE